MFPPKEFRKRKKGKVEKGKELKLRYTINIGKWI